ncbi:MULTISPECIES: MCE family protein [Streptomyces]|uniref:MCE family protein n=2 Tax=Streptomyces TaxID=1883 RepID=A0A3M8FC41_9ACTN|nr:MULTISPECIES: MlaD family protein [Streptomyces]KNE81755.1 ABC transporter substrate-binding protein [Streptomyces fradiae]OFA50649.1 ABC transporter substrate-binding protein [Streptomyces fradiae]PQM24080.1 MCE family protein [Streptomyces xinghaiensis]RKM97044.1 MCE family protein [Streptomyces xinghaiensis]RNC75562.1 MCE family protein [Streptomyces xinghaiensis]
MSRTNARTTAPQLIKLSVFAVVTVAATAVLAATIVNISLTPKETYTAVFSDVTSLEEGDDIRVAGVRVGEVDSIEIKDRTLAEVTFTVSRDRPLLTSTRAAIRYRSLIGQRYIALTEGTGDATRLRPGGRIPLARTEPALDLNALLNGFKPLFAALSPKDVNQLATEIVMTLQGEGGTVRSLLAHTASLTTTLAERDKVIGSVIDNLNTVLETVDKRSTRFSDLIVQLQRLISGLSADRKPIGKSLAGINALAEATSGLLEDARPPLKTDIAELGELGGTLNDHEKTVEGVLKRLPDKLNKLTGTASYGSWFNFYLCDFDGRIVLPKTSEAITPELHVARARCGR